MAFVDRVSSIWNICIYSFDDKFAEVFLDIVCPILHRTAATQKRFLLTISSFGLFAYWPIYLVVFWLPIIAGLALPVLLLISFWSTSFFIYTHPYSTSRERKYTMLTENKHHQCSS